MCYNGRKGILNTICTYYTYIYSQYVYKLKNEIIPKKSGMEEMDNVYGLFIPHSQSQKYHLQNAMVWKNGKLNSELIISNETEETVEMKKVFEEIIDDVPTDISHSHELAKDHKLHLPHVTSRKFVEMIQSIIANIQNNEEVFLDNIVINVQNTSHSYEMMGKVHNSAQTNIKKYYEHEYAPNLEEWSHEEILKGEKDDKAKLVDLFYDRSVIVKMDVYMPLPYPENVLSSDAHSIFLRDFQKKWKVERPWRYVSVRNWIITPRVSVYGSCSFGIDCICDYASDLRYALHKFFAGKAEDNYRAIRKLYAYLLFLRDMAEFSDICKTANGEIQCYAAKEYEPSTTNELILSLESLFNESSVSFIYGRMCEIKTLDVIQRVYPRLDPLFVDQSKETIAHLLREHHISLNEKNLVNYITTKVKEFLDDYHINIRKYIFPYE